MKTLKELKGVFIGEFLTVVMFELFLEIYSFITDQTMNWDAEAVLIIFGWFGFTIVMTYLGWTLYKGIKSDVNDISEHLKKKDTKKA